MTPAPAQRNPLIDEIDAAHAQLSEPAKMAIARAAGPAPGMIGVDQGALTGPVPAMALPNQPQGRPLTMPEAPNADLPATQRFFSVVPPIKGPNSNLDDATAERDRIQRTGSGVSQIKNPWARIPLQILDAVGGAALPGVAAAIPGTSMHHAVVERGAERRVNDLEAGLNDEQKRENEQITAANTQAQTEAIPSQTAYRNAQTAALGNAEEGAEKTIETANGILQWNPATKKYDIPVGPAPGKTTANVHVLPDGSVVSVEHDQKTGTSTANVLYKGDPAIQTHVIERPVGGKTHTILVNAKTGEDIKDLGEAGAKPAAVNVNTGGAALDRETNHFAAPHQKNIDAANQQLEKIIDAKSLLTTGTAESQALAVPKVLTALVSGQGTGVRITQAELSQIANATGIKGSFENWLSGISGKGKINPEQRSQLTQVLDQAAARLQQKREIANDALNSINGARSRDEMAKFDQDARQRLIDMEKGSAVATQVFRENGKEYHIPADQVAAFKKDHPNAR